MVLYEQLKLKTFEKATGRKRALSNTEVITLALYKHTQGIPTKKAIWKDFGLTCTYKTFCESVNRLLPPILLVLCTLIALNRKHAHTIKYTDSTEVPVCLNKNAKYHKTMSAFATWGEARKASISVLNCTSPPILKDDSSHSSSRTQTLTIERCF